ncbi:hypothetical protein CDD83_137 [Cordyceps sp. RAO-2017]|nr:hypothetical protein CDD83_137 [Cordyceps sp. RAO-2017]
MASAPASIHVFARWRPLGESQAGPVQYSTTGSDAAPTSLLAVSVQGPTDEAPGRGGGRRGRAAWTSPPAYRRVFGPGDDNGRVADEVVAPSIPKLLRGESCSVFAYGHSGSGKTHTILGYDFGHRRRLGLSLAAARDLFDALARDRLLPDVGVGLSLFELRNRSALDLLGGRAECHVRQGPDGRVHVRGETELLDGDRVRVRPVVQEPCWSFDALRRRLVQAVGGRAVGSSGVHDQSSRTHAVLELELVSRPLVDARCALVDRQSELVPVGKRATDVSIEEQTKALVRTPDGGWAPNPDYPVPDQARIDAAEADKARFEERVRAAEREVRAVLAASPHACLGAKMLFVDLAGAEYQQAEARAQSAQERQEGRQINTDLLALKEVMRAWARGQPRIPFRSSALTMVLREHFLSAHKGNSSVIVTASSAPDDYAGTLNALKYGSLIGSSTA